MGESFKKSNRLLKRSQYQALFQKKRTFSLRLQGACQGAGQDPRDAQRGRVVLDWSLSRKLLPRIGITVTKKQGSSVQRNRFKRIVREAFRKSPLSRGALGVDMNIRCRGHLVECQKDGISQNSVIDIDVLRELFLAFQEYLLSLKIVQRGVHIETSE